MIFYLLSGSDSKVSDIDGKPYTTLLYSNGPGHTDPRSIVREAGKDSIQVRKSARFSFPLHDNQCYTVYQDCLPSGNCDIKLAAHSVKHTHSQLSTSYISIQISYRQCIGKYFIDKSLNLKRSEPSQDFSDLNSKYFSFCMNYLPIIFSLPEHFRFISRHKNKLLSNIYLCKKVASSV